MKIYQQLNKTFLFYFYQGLLSDTVDMLKMLCYTLENNRFQFTAF